MKPQIAAAWCLLAATGCARHPGTETSTNLEIRRGAELSTYAAFYTPPDPLPPGMPGDLIRTEPSRLVLEPSGQLGAIMATGTRIMYRSTDARGNPMTVTGTYFEPSNHWPGQGPRPLMCTAPAPRGKATSVRRRASQPGHPHWSPYLGLGAPGLHTYVNRVAQGNAMLDAGRAALRLPSTSLDLDGPLAFWGYSQGGGAAASAAELASSYAPELDVVGTYAGAPTADLKELLPYADGTARRCGGLCAELGDHDLSRVRGGSSRC